MRIKLGTPGYELEWEDFGVDGQNGVKNRTFLGTDLHEYQYQIELDAQPISM